jgi:ABC-2 type transport system permease protein
MAGLLIKDFINLRKNVKIFASFTLIYGFMAYASQDTSFFSTIFTILCTILTLNLYAFDETAKWDSYALTMPVSRDNIVQGKYLMMLLLTLIGITVGALFALLLHFTVGVGSPILGIRNCTIGGGVAILFYCIALPFITKMGVEKTKYFLLALYIIPFVGVVMLIKTIGNGTVELPGELINLAQYLLKNIYLCMIGVIVVALGISYTLSINIYRKKEF